MTTIEDVRRLDLQETPYGKVIGVVDDRDELRAVFAAVSAFGVERLEIECGSRGSAELEGAAEAVAGSFLGDMEEETVDRYRAAVRDGQIVFAANVDSKMANDVAQAAKSAGATGLVHFGHWVITNY